jgi:probable HAF family extracellular repeat protein
MKKHLTSLRSVHIGLLIALSASLHLGVASAQTLINVGTFGGGSNAAGINDAGQVTGESTNSSADALYAYLYSGGSLQNLGTLPGDSGSEGYAINNSGEVVGYSANNNGTYTAVSISGGAVSGLGVPGTFSYATGVNNSGQVVGDYTTTNGNTDAFLISGGTFTTIGGYEGRATGINNSGEVIGTNSSGSYTYYNGTTTELPTLGGINAYTYAHAINDLGQIVGNSNNSAGLNDAFLYSNGTMTDLGTLPGGNTNIGENFNSTALGINNSGEVVGYSAISSSRFANTDAFVYTVNAGMQDMNKLYASLLVSGTGSQTGFTTLTEATGINNLGDIIGDGTYWNGTADVNEGFVLTPAATPEPSAWLLGLIVITALGGLRVRSKVEDIV